MMSRRVFIIALIASLCVALPTTDLVVPEAKDAGTSGAEFVQSTLKSGGTETQCRTFATDTISSINSGVTSEQGVLAAIDTGSGCDQEGQPGVATATTNKADADADVVTKTQAVTDATATQTTACNAPVTMVVNLPTLTASTCYDYTQEAQFLSVQAACDAANTALSQANSALGLAQTAATDAQIALDAEVAEAARLESECHCRVQAEQGAAWTAAQAATASHVADWKQAHEVLCAIDQTSTCTVPTCPAVTQPTLANGVDAENCSVTCRANPDDLNGQVFSGMSFHGHTYTINVGTEVTQTSESVSAGTYSSTDSASSPKTQSYTGGSMAGGCSSSLPGKKRVSTISFYCGKTTQITAITEAVPCDYRITFETPGCCEAPTDMCECTGNGNEYDCTQTGKGYCQATQNCINSGDGGVEYGDWSNICYDKPTKNLVNLGGNGQANMQTCEGDCDSDSDCAGSLQCFQREQREAVPGCANNADVPPNYDFCYDPNH